ncbi:hypothetical protein U9M48_011439 [Paspalum notatum var. saurae]|uniref:Alpha-ketoglutarate-dependent dioxygenase AlkB-like domain-containing protein n=1 Tax=Paspalum notatum var. saurae TaxID=547442 RepID=A0AAQ3WHD1_PASNO
MVLLKGFVKPEDQIGMVRMCRQLGKGPGGFYRPSFKNGAKLNLWMMSLGKNWDPTLRSYGPTRPFDGAQAPTIPDAFKMIAQTTNSTASEFPQINPDIYIVNYYTNSGKLGLHQDKDESESSLTKGLPFISISIGDTAEFLFGDTGDKDQATKINLESGDVLILGGESRHFSPCNP